MSDEPWLSDWESEGGIVPTEDDEVYYGAFTVERSGDMVWLTLSTPEDARVIAFSPEDAFSVGLALCSAGQDAYDPSRVEHGADEATSGPEIPANDEIPPPSE